MCSQTRGRWHERNIQPTSTEEEPIAEHIVYYYKSSFIIAVQLAVWFFALYPILAQNLWEVQNSHLTVNSYSEVNSILLALAA